MMQDNHNLAQMELLYKKFYVRLHRYAQTFLEDEDEATDVVGEVFLQIWESWQVGATINERKNIAAYLYTRVRNSCLDHLRHRKAIDNYNTFLKATSPFTTDAEVEDFEKRITRLREAIENLPPSDRRVLKAVYFEHLQELRLRLTIAYFINLANSLSKSSPRKFLPTMIPLLSTNTLAGIPLML